MWPVLAVCRSSRRHLAPGPAEEHAGRWEALVKRALRPLCRQRQAEAGSTLATSV